jgi:hypothetical protein
MKTTLERLGVPNELAYFHGLIQFRERSVPTFRKIVDRKYDKTLRRYVDTLKSFEVYGKVSTIPVGMNKHYALNFLSDMLGGQQFDYVNPNLLEKQRKVFTMQAGPQIGKEFWIMGQRIELDNAGFTWRNGSVFMNTEKGGAPSEGWNTFPVEHTINLYLSSTVNGVKTTTIKTQRYTQNIEFTKAQLEALGFTDEMLTAHSYMRYDRTTPDTNVYLTDVSTDLEQIEDNVYWPNVYFNGKDDNSFDFKKLIPHYAATTPDFVVRVRGYNDSTNEDYPEPNYSGMGNFGKCFDIPMENEAVKPVRIEFGEQYSFENNDEEIVVTFANDGQRAIVGMAIEYKPLDGKKVDNEIFMNARTGEVFHDIFDAV